MTRSKRAAGEGLLLQVNCHTVVSKSLAERNVYSEVLKEHTGSPFLKDLNHLKSQLHGSGKAQINDLLYYAWAPPCQTTQKQLRGRGVPGNGI